MLLLLLLLLMMMMNGLIIIAAAAAAAVTAAATAAAAADGYESLLLLVMMMMMRVMMMSHGVLWGVLILTACRLEAQEDATREPILSSFLYASILAHDSFERSLAFILANRLADSTLLPTQLFELFYEVLSEDEHVRGGALADLHACRTRVGGWVGGWEGGHIKVSLLAGFGPHPPGGVEDPYLCQALLYLKGA